MVDDPKQFDPLPVICSFFIPGSGQLIQGRNEVAFRHILFWILLWIVLLGWLVHVYSCFEAYGWEKNK